MIAFSLEIGIYLEEVTEIITLSHVFLINKQTYLYTAKAIWETVNLFIH